MFHKGFLAALLPLAACTSIELEGKDAQGYRWAKDGIEVQRANWRYHVVADGNLFLSCENHSKALACSRMERDGSSCDIYLAAVHEPWVKAHEEKHCAGWRHPDSLRHGFVD